jgi:hypothetical protein
MIPKRVAVGFSFDQHHVSNVAGLGEPLLAIKAQFASRFPTEAVALVLDPKPHRRLVAGCAEVGHAHRWFSAIGAWRYAQGLEEVDRQRLRSRIVIESKACFVLLL